MQLYRCIEVEGRYWLGADMRLECYTPQWAGYAVYGIVCGLLYIVGFPLGVFVILCRNRQSLFDDKVPLTRVKYGFLYEVRCSMRLLGKWWRSRDVRVTMHPIHRDVRVLIWFVVQIARCMDPQLGGGR